MRSCRLFNLEKNRTMYIRKESESMAAEKKRNSLKSHQMTTVNITKPRMWRADVVQ